MFFLYGLVLFFVAALLEEWEFHIKCYDIFLQCLDGELGREKPSFKFKIPKK